MLTLALASTSLPRFILLEDANDLAAMAVMTGRAVKPGMWAEDAYAEACDAANEGFAHGFF